MKRYFGKAFAVAHACGSEARRKRLFVGGLLAAGLAIGTAPSAGAQCGVDWINQQTCDNIMREYMVGQNFDVYLSYLVPDPNDRAAVRDYLWHSRI